MYPGAIKSAQKEIFNRLKYFPRFYLAGGTALALQIGHRISIDFDLFSEKEIPSNLLDKTRRIFKDSKIKVVINHSEQLSIEVNKTKIDFVKYSFPPLLSLSEFGGVKLLSVVEIGGVKAYNLGRRLAFKDYIDLYFILKEKFASLSKIINFSKKKYKEKFNERLFLEQLISLKEVEETPIEFLKEKVSKDELKSFFEKEIKKLKL